MNDCNGEHEDDGLFGDSKRVLKVAFGLQAFRDYLSFYLYTTAARVRRRIFGQVWVMSTGVILRYSSENMQANHFCLILSGYYDGLVPEWRVLGAVKMVCKGNWGNI